MLRYETEHETLSTYVLVHNASCYCVAQCNGAFFHFQCCSHVYNLMLLNCRALYALKFALLSKTEAMYHLALENMKDLKVESVYLVYVVFSSVSCNEFMLLIYFQYNHNL